MGRVFGWRWFAGAKGAVLSACGYAIVILKPAGLASSTSFICALITKLAARNQPWAAARLARLMIRTMPVSVQDGATVGLKARTSWRVLLLPRSTFIDDAVSTLRIVPEIEVVALPRRVFKAIAEAILPREVDDNNYMSTSPGAQAAMLRYRAFLARFWRHLGLHGRVHAVISGNFAYYAEREFAAALEAVNVPFIVLHKENSWSPGLQEFWAQVYRERRGPFLGRRILVYSPIERDLQVASGVVDSERIEVVGMPRLDEVHRWRRANIGAVPEPLILFASFLPDVGMPALRKSGISTNSDNKGDTEYEMLSVASLCRSTHRALVRLAVAHPQILVVVKTKGRTRDRMQILELLGVRDERELPCNMRVVHGGSPLPLLSRSAVVCGLHSTLLVEALAAGRPVVVPWFAEVLEPAVARYVFDLGPAAVKSSSPSELIELLSLLALKRTAVPGTLPPSALNVLRDWVGNDDGKAGERAAEAIMGILRMSHSSG